MNFEKCTWFKIQFLFSILAPEAAPQINLLVSETPRTLLLQWKVSIKIVSKIKITFMWLLFCRGLIDSMFYLWFTICSTLQNILENLFDLSIVWKEVSFLLNSLSSKNLTFLTLYFQLYTFPHQLMISVVLLESWCWENQWCHNRV